MKVLCVDYADHLLHIPTGVVMNYVFRKEHIHPDSGVAVGSQAVLCSGELGNKEVELTPFREVKIIGYKDLGDYVLYIVQLGAFKPSWWGVHGRDSENYLVLDF